VVFFYFNFRCISHLSHLCCTPRQHTSMSEERVDPATRFSSGLQTALLHCDRQTKIVLFFFNKEMAPLFISSPSHSIEHLFGQTVTFNEHIIYLWFTAQRLEIAHIVHRWMLRSLVNNELVRNKEKTIVPSFETGLLFRHLPGGTEENRQKISVNHLKPSGYYTYHPL
jgi:hypothetical protein